MVNKPIAIIAAMAEELAHLSNQLSEKYEESYQGLIFICGFLGDVPVVLTQSGIGKVNASIATTLMIDRFDPALVINTGSAGALARDCGLGDIVIATRATFYDVDVTAFGYAPGQMAQMPVDYACDPAWVLAAEKAAHNSETAFEGRKVHQGLIISGDRFIADKTAFSAIKATFPDAMALEMEGAAILQTCYCLSVPALVIRAISDLADSDAPMSFEHFLPLAAKQSAQLVLQLLASPPTSYSQKSS